MRNEPGWLDVAVVVVSPVIFLAHVLLLMAAVLVVGTLGSLRQAWLWR